MRADRNCAWPTRNRVLAIKSICSLLLFKHILRLRNQIFQFLHRCSNILLFHFGLIKQGINFSRRHHTNVGIGLLLLFVIAFQIRQVGFDAFDGPAGSGGGRLANAAGLAGLTGLFGLCWDCSDLMAAISTTPQGLRGCWDCSDLTVTTGSAATD